MPADLIVRSHRLSLDDADADMRRLVDYWTGRRQGKPQPARRDLDVIDLGPWLGRINLFEAPGDEELRVRLRGSLLGYFRGHLADGVLIRHTRPKPYAESLIRDHRETIAAGAPARHRLELDLDGLRYSFDRLTLPLAAGGGLPPMLLVLIQFDPRRSREFWRRYLETQDGRGADSASFIR